MTMKDKIDELAKAIRDTQSAIGTERDRLRSKSVALCIEVNKRLCMNKAERHFAERDDEASDLFSSIFGGKL